jgi:pimeloyl-ACP methyl ester carboxylesterase
MSAILPTLSDLHIDVHSDIATPDAAAPTVMVHGGWTDGTTWRFVAPELAHDRTVVTYDRRGHSRSTWPTPVTRRQDEDDLLDLIQTTGAPVHLVSSSYGGAIALTVAARRPELVLSVAAHEPALLAAARAGTPLGDAILDVKQWMTALADEIAAGRHEAGARQFFSEVAGPGAWELFPASLRTGIVANAATFLSMLRDPNWDQITAIPDTRTPVLLTKGTTSPAWLADVVDALVEQNYAHATYRCIEGAGHSPHLTHADVYTSTVRTFIHDVEGTSGCRDEWAEAE